MKEVMTKIQEAEAAAQALRQQAQQEAWDIEAQAQADSRQALAEAKDRAAQEAAQRVYRAGQEAEERVSTREAGARTRGDQLKNEAEARLQAAAQLIVGRIVADD